jgi:hypothetical protein
VIPVFIDESEDADHVLSQSAFEPVWQVLKARCSRRSGG